MVNGRTKGHDAEREIARKMNDIIEQAYRAKYGELSPDWKPQVVRNQMQSAVGGDDLAGTYNFSIEVKRQEELSLNTWWAQACRSAARQGKQPVLIYKQNRKPWKVIMGGAIKHDTNSPTYHRVDRVEITLEDFLELFTKVVYSSL